MAEVSFDPIIKWLRGKIGGLVFRRGRKGKVFTYETPDMSGVKWSQAQKAHRRGFGDASYYASAAVADPDIRPIYVQMAIDNDGDPRRPGEMAFMDYKQGNDLLWKKHMGDQEKPADWRMEHYSWYYTRRRPPVYKKRRK
jgi:hypothetical protein